MSQPPPPPDYSSLALIAAGLWRKHYLQITFYFPRSVNELVAHNQVQQVVNASDWLRLANNCWIVWTNESPEQWYQKLAGLPLLKEASILILKVDVSRNNRAGQLPDWAWEWLDKAR